MATKDRTLVAIVLFSKELTEYVYQQEAGFLLRSRDIWEVHLDTVTSEAILGLDIHDKM